MCEVKDSKETYQVGLDDSDSDIQGLDDSDSDIQGLDDLEDEINSVLYLASEVYQSDAVNSNTNFHSLPGIYEVDLKTLCINSTMINNMVDNDSTFCDVFSRDSSKVILVKNGKEKSEAASDMIVSKVADWINFHVNRIPPKIRKPIRSVNFIKLLKDCELPNKRPPLTDDEINWYNIYVDMSPGHIFELIQAANYLGMTQNETRGGLLHFGCSKIATLIKGKSPDEIQIILDAQSTSKADVSDE